MRIYIFRSETTELRAFAADKTGTALPQGFAPWRSAGVIEPDELPPNNLSRMRIESAIKVQGFQLWRTKRPAKIAPTGTDGIPVL